ncbi:MAG: sulfatase-like hydrolase/transferase [Deltaproteobacteria bacterium]|nr:sulfatase-like hydrolase/transferase [Deltaproteobacteria bacterium]MBW2417761.1 sulfatase-like hydrolase/transferase [Deltaproteobacteria bacterium]
MRTGLGSHADLVGRLVACVACLALSSAGILGCWEAGDAARPPNIVLIVSDDQGYRDFGFMGAEHARTPNLDVLAASGTVFRNGFSTSSLCGPALRSLLTGLQPYQWDARMDLRRERGIARKRGYYMLDYVTLPGLLQERGYRSFQGGKLVEQTYQAAGFTHGLSQEGDDFRFGGPATELGRSASLDPLFEFIDESGDEPFFLWFAPMLPHSPHDAPKAQREPFAGRGLSDQAVAYYANVLRFDALVGELLDHLDRGGQRENTLIVFLADNGWDQAPDYQWLSRRVDGAHGKMTMYELGFRTPIVFSWPGRVPAGQLRDELVSGVDLFPTLLDWAGAAPRPERPGFDLRPLIEEGGAWPREVVIGSMRFVRPHPLRPPDRDPISRGTAEPAFFLRTPRWYYIWYEDWGRDQLFDMESDPGQSLDRVDEHPQLRRRFRGQIEQWRKAMAESMSEVADEP